MDRAVTIRDGRVSAEGRGGAEYVVVGPTGSCACRPTPWTCSPPGARVEVEVDGDQVVLKPTGTGGTNRDPAGSRGLGGPARRPQRGRRGLHGGPRRPGGIGRAVRVGASRPPCCCWPPEPPDAGVVRLDGEDLAALGPAGRQALRRDRVALVFQGYGPLSLLTAGRTSSCRSAARRDPGAAATPPGAGWPARAGLPGPGRPAHRPALGRGAPAGRPGPRPGRRAGHPAGRRAHRRGRGEPRRPSACSATPPTAAVVVATHDPEASTLHWAWRGWSTFRRVHPGRGRWPGRLTGSTCCCPPRVGAVGLPAGPLGPADALRLGTRLRRRHPAELVAAALAQRELRSGRRLFRPGGCGSPARVEQASAEPLARHRAARYAGADRVADLCRGIGGDLSAPRPGPGRPGRRPRPAAPAHGPENARVHGVGEVAAACADVQILELPRSLAVFVDPARRAGVAACRRGRATRRWPGAWSWPAGSPRSGSRPPPALNRVPPGWEVELLADRRELKEAVLWSPWPPPAAGPPSSQARPPWPPSPDPPGSGRALRPAGRLPARPQPGRDPGRPGRGPGLRPGSLVLDPQIAFLSADQPWPQLLRPAAGRPRLLPWHLKRLREVLRQRGVGAVEVRKRGSAVDATT